MKDTGFLKYFLGIEVFRNASGLYLSQRKYALDIILETGLFGAKPASTLVEQNHNLAIDKGPLFASLDLYCRLIGRLIYLTITQPEFSYSVHIFTQFMQQLRR